jgi:hypothetical protein
MLRSQAPSTWFEEAAAYKLYPRQQGCPLLPPHSVCMLGDLHHIYVALHAAPIPLTLVIPQITVLICFMSEPCPPEASRI